jgi:hypothetical protein
MNGHIRSGRRLPRFVALGVLVASWAGSGVIAAPMALAAHREDGDDPGSPISAGRAIMILAGVPVSAMLLITVLVALPSMMRGPRYRLGEEWKGRPEWFAPPPAQVEAAPESGTHGGGGRRRRPEGEHSGEAGDGGSSARW